MIKARPGINGNTVQDFVTAWEAVQAACIAVNKAGNEVLSNAVHWRNYQHIGNMADSDAAIIKDRRRVQADIQKAMALLGEIGSDIVDILDELERK